jgi:hypothetical protein
MRLINVKFIEISTNGTVNFSYKGLKTVKQVGFYEKDLKNAMFSKKTAKKQLSLNLQKNLYKSKYKF